MPIMLPQVMIRTVQFLEEIEPIRAQIRCAADKTAHELRKAMDEQPDGIELLRRMKFTKMGFQPLVDEKLNLVEQINQTWTCLVSLNALPFLFARHPDAGGFQLNLGAGAGTDILSIAPGIVAAETFAAVHPSNNAKLSNDMRKLARQCPDARARYVFFASPEYGHERQHRLRSLELGLEGIEVWSIEV